MRSRDRFRGCLLAGAAGDALGYAVEFLTEQEIRKTYGERGITAYALKNGQALISDDTQMTLYTANGLLLGSPRGTLEDVAACYRDWVRTQGYTLGGTREPQAAWLNHIPALHHARAPGNTCLGSLLRETLGSLRRPLNSSKGCGGVMRVAPVGLYYLETDTPVEASDRLAAEAAALTHGHEMGYIPAAMLAHIVRLLAGSEGMSVAEATRDAQRAMQRLFADAASLPALQTLCDLALSLADDDTIPAQEAIHRLGEGWVGDEALAIAIFCAARHENDLEQALIAAVNHRGDSDSTGAVTGNILGARLGMAGIPETLLTHLELKETILTIADDLFDGCPRDPSGAITDPVWVAKYIDHRWRG